MTVRRTLIIAAAVGTLSAAAVVVSVPLADTPRLFVSGVEEIEIYGGSTAYLRGESEPAVRDAAGAIRERMHDWSASYHGDQLVLGIPNLDPDAAHQILAQVLRGGTLELVHVEAETELAKQLYMRAEDGGEVDADIDLWTATQTRERFRDYYVHAASCDALRAFVEAADIQPGPGQRIVYEWTQDARELEPQCRTYVVSDTIVTGPDLRGASVMWNPDTNRPEVRLRLSDAAAQRFGDFTRDHVGHKLAIVISGNVESAPVIQSAIYGGEVSITMGSGDRKKMETEAFALARTLGHPPIAGGLTLDRIEPFEPILARDELVVGRLIFAVCIGIGAALVVFALLWLLPAPRREPKTVTPAPRAPLPWLAIAVTGSGALLIYLSTYIPLPTIALDPLRAVLGPDARTPGLFDLGIAPVITAYVVVELIAVAVPRWRHLRIGGPDGRARLGRAVAALAVGIGVVQGYFVAQTYGSMQPGLDSFLIGPMPVVTTTLSLAAGPLVYALVAGGISRFGFVNGYSAIIGVTCVIELGRWGDGLWMQRHLGDAPPLAYLVVIGGLLLAAFATWRVLRARVGDDGSPFRLPTCGIIPLGDSTALLSALLMLGTLGIALPPALLELLSPIGGAALALDLALSIGFGVVYAWLFSRPRPLISDGPRLADPQALTRRFWRATAASIGFVCGLWLIRTGMLELSPTLMFDVITAALLVAIALDAAGEWRARRRLGDDLVEVWPVHRIQAVDVVAGAVRGEGIEVYTRGVHHRSLLLFFAPYVPVGILVPRKHAERAREIAASTLGATDRGSTGSREPSGSAATADSA